MAPELTAEGQDTVTRLVSDYVTRAVAVPVGTGQTADLTGVLSSVLAPTLTAEQRATLTDDGVPRLTLVKTDRFDVAASALGRRRRAGGGGQLPDRPADQRRHRRQRAGRHHRPARRPHLRVGADARAAAASGGSTPSPSPSSGACRERPPVRLVRWAALARLATVALVVALLVATFGRRSIEPAGALPTIRVVSTATADARWTPQQPLFLLLLGSDMRPGAGCGCSDAIHVVGRARRRRPGDDDQRPARHPRRRPGPGDRASSTRPWPPAGPSSPRRPSAS